jgi:hypothetical protein
VALHSPSVDAITALSQLSDDLFGGVLPVLHGCAVLLPQNNGGLDSHSGWINSWGPGQRPGAVVAVRLRAPWAVGVWWCRRPGVVALSVARFVPGVVGCAAVSGRSVCPALPSPRDCEDGGSRSRLTWN